MALIFEDLNNVAAPQDNVVKTGSMQSFKADVVDDSKNRVVLAYFLSPQNPACEQFGQLLENMSGWPTAKPFWLNSTSRKFSSWLYSWESKASRQQ